MKQYRKYNGDIFIKLTRQSADINIRVVCYVNSRATKASGISLQLKFIEAEISKTFSSKQFIRGFISSKYFAVSLGILCRIRRKRFLTITSLIAALDRKTTISNKRKRMMLSFLFILFYNKIGCLFTYSNYLLYGIGSLQ